MKAKSIPHHKIKRIEIRGVCWLIVLGKQRSPDLIHQPRHGSLGRISCVSRCSIHDEEAVGVDASSEPVEEVAHCRDESPGCYSLALLEDVETGPPVRQVTSLFQASSVCRLGSTSAFAGMLLSGDQDPSGLCPLSGVRCATPGSSLQQS